MPGVTTQTIMGVAACASSPSSSASLQSGRKAVLQLEAMAQLAA